jgi:hypothetical protein
MRRYSIILIVIFFLISSFGCDTSTSTKLADYEPKSSEEEKIVKIFIKKEETVKNRDLSNYLTIYHPDAVVKIWRPDR